jgi:hypothetical protein
MNNRPVLELGAEVPESAARILEGVGLLTVKRGRRVSQLRLDGTVVPVTIVAGGLRPYAHATAPILAALLGEGHLGLVVANRLPAHVRRELEAAGCAYADGTGAVHIVLPGLILHVEPSLKPAPATAPGGVGVVGVRLVQTVLSEPEREWTVQALAEAAGSSQGQAHNIMVRLESEGFVGVSGRGPARRRRVVDPAALLDWLATVPSARRIRERLYTYLYTPDADGLTTYLSYCAHEYGLVYAVTGIAGALVFGVRTVTAAPVAMVRVDPELDLRAAAEKLRAEPVESGANLMLVRDVGHLGVHSRQYNGPVALAPLPRIWLDMLGEPRGDDAGALFREAAIGW